MNRPPISGENLRDAVITMAIDHPNDPRVLMGPIKNVIAAYARQNNLSQLWVLEVLRQEVEELLVGELANQLNPKNPNKSTWKAAAAEMSMVDPRPDFNNFSSSTLNRKYRERVSRKWPGHRK